MFAVIISISGDQLLSLLNDIHFWGNDLHSSVSVHVWNCPSTNPLSKMGMCPRPSQKGALHSLSERFRHRCMTQLEAKRHSRTLRGLLWEPLHFQRHLNLERFGLNSLPGVLVLHKAWKGRSVEGWQQTREDNGILMTWIAPLHLLGFPDFSVIVSVFPFFWLY